MQLEAMRGLVRSGGSVAGRVRSALATLAVTAGVAGAVGVAGVGAVAPAMGQALIASAPTFQGVIQTASGVPLAGPVDLLLGLYDSATGGTALQEVTNTNVVLDNGRFATSLGFDPRLMGSVQGRWLQVAYRPAGQNAEWTAASGRQPLAPTPTALTIAGLEVIANEAVDQSTLGAVLGPPLPPGAPLAQTFTPGVSGELRSIDVVVAAPGQVPSQVMLVLTRSVPGGASAPLAQVTQTVVGSGAQTVRFMIAGVAVQAGEEMTIGLTTGGGPPVTWLCSAGDVYPGGRANLDPGRDFLFATRVTSRANRSTFSFSGDVSGDNIVGGGGSFTGDVTASNGSFTNLTVASTFNGNVANFSGTVTADRVSGGLLRTNQLETSLVLANSGAYGGRVAIGATALGPDVPLQVVRNNVGANWHVYLTNGQAQPAFQNTGMRVSDLGFFEISNNIASGNLARLNGLGQWTAVSDGRLKTDIADAEPGELLGAALRLRPVHYRYKSEEPGSARHLGFIAQDVQAVLPEFVADDGRTLTLDYAGLSTVAIGATRELAAKFDAARARNEQLRAENRALMLRLEKLERAER